MARDQREEAAPIPASVMLQELHDHAPPDHVTLRWLTSSLDKQSFGLVMLVLAIVTAVPGIGSLAAILLLIPAFQMIAGRPAPVFPRWIADRPIPTRRLGPAVQRSISILSRIEKAVYPRWPTPPEMTNRVVGIFVIVLVARLLLSLIPFSNIAPGALIALISLAYLEKDGLLLSISLAAAVALLAVDLGLVWEFFLRVK